MAVEIRAIRESEQEECLALWQTVFGDPRAYFERYFRGDAEYLPDYTLCALVDGRLASAAQIVRRVVSLPGCTLTMGGIANVATLPGHRGRGLSTACLARAIETMRADAMDVSILFTGVAAFYARLGWEETSVPRMSAALDPHRLALSAPGPCPRPYARGDDEGLRSLYASANGERPLTVRRGPPYWRDWIGWDAGRAPGRAMVIDSASQLRGYALSRARGESARVRELVARGDDLDVMAALLADAAAAAASEGARTLRIEMPASAAAREAARRALGSVDVEDGRGPMVRFLDVERLLGGLMPLLLARWSAAGRPGGRIAAREPGGQRAAIVEAAARGLTVRSAAQPAAGALTQSELFGLLVGCERAFARVNDEGASLARALFPRCDPWFWALDAF
ncbi:MAG: GNAT family N-acetyltransferase [Chthonomonadales bacterium]|nr:GNAT family N-acetyltransferase [Chthonomonadales bacterium]